MFLFLRWICESFENGTIVKTIISKLGLLKIVIDSSDKIIGKFIDELLGYFRCVLL